MKKKGDPFDLGKPSDPRGQCWSKVKYYTRDEALQVARLMGPEMGTYCCPWSPRARRHWHVGHTKDRSTLVTSFHIKPSGSRST